MTSGPGCASPLGSQDDCTMVANQESLVLAHSLIAKPQAEDDRPAGCWWQFSSGSGTSSMLFFNVPPAGVGQPCSDVQRCMCCSGGGGSTTTTTVVGTGCTPRLVTLGAPYDLNSCP